MREEANEGNNTDKKERESDKREGMGPQCQMPWGSQRDRRDKEVVSGFGQERARVFSVEQLGWEPISSRCRIEEDVGKRRQREEPTFWRRKA